MADGSRPQLASAQRYAERLLCDLGEQPPRPVAAPDTHPALAWAQSGVMQLTGQRAGPPLMCPAPLASCADGALAALAALAPPGSLDGLQGSALLAERAALTGHFRAGASSPGGACRLLQAADGWFALTLAREEDWSAVPAWLETSAATWDAVTSEVRCRPMGELLERGRLLGLAVGAPEQNARASWCQIATVGTPAPQRHRSPRVVDLSSLWAGPLCSHLLQRLGAEVIKVESWQRPDGARRGSAAFFDLLNENKRSVALDFGRVEDRRRLHRLIASADIVIEGSRPRALRQLGIYAEKILRETPGLTWIGISAYGRGEPHEHWAGYGDDATVAAGVSELMFRAAGARVLVGDALADPLTGIHAALAAWATWRAGGGQLVSLALRDVVRHCVQFDLPADDAALRRRQHDWTLLAQSNVRAPRPRVARGNARAIGTDTVAVVGDL